MDGCPARVPLTEQDIQVDLDRRRPGQSEIVSPRDEEDRCQILSGVFENLTLGTPISVMVWNKDARPQAYREMESAFRPSHADYTYQAKYGIRNWQGGGRSSARETIGQAAYNVTPPTVGAYFSKLNCFCFTEQRLRPGERRDLAVVFFLDPKLEQDETMKDVDTLTLSYTLYPAREAPKPAEKRS